MLRAVADRSRAENVPVVDADDSGAELAERAAVACDSIQAVREAAAVHQTMTGFFAAGVRFWLRRSGAAVLVGDPVTVETPVHRR